MMPNTKPKFEHQKSVIAARKKLCFEPGQIGNTHEVPLTFNVTLKRSKGDKSTTLKTSMHEGKNITILVCHAEDKRKFYQS
jgi:hypothetical protein